MIHKQEELIPCWQYDSTDLETIAPNLGSVGEQFDALPLCIVNHWHSGFISLIVVSRCAKSGITKFFCSWLYNKVGFKGPLFCWSCVAAAAVVKSFTLSVTVFSYLGWCLSCSSDDDRRLAGIVETFIVLYCAIWNSKPWCCHVIHWHQWCKSGNCCRHCCCSVISLLRIGLDRYSTEGNAVERGFSWATHSRSRPWSSVHIIFQSTSTFQGSYL